MQLEIGSLSLEFIKYYYCSSWGDYSSSISITFPPGNIILKDTASDNPEGDRVMRSPPRVDSTALLSSSYRRSSGRMVYVAEADGKGYYFIWVLWLWLLK